MTIRLARRRGGCRGQGGAQVGAPERVQQQPYGGAPSRSRRSGPAVARVEESAKWPCGCEGGCSAVSKPLASQASAQSREKASKPAGRPAASEQRARRAALERASTTLIELWWSEAGGERAEDQCSEQRQRRRAAGGEAAGNGSGRAAGDRSTKLAGSIHPVEYLAGSIDGSNWIDRSSCATEADVVI